MTANLWPGPAPANPPVDAQKEALLRVEGLTKSFNGRAAIADVSLAAFGHELTAVLGPSGAGKTTLFRCITGLLKPDRGSAWLGGDDIATLTGRRRRRIALVFQQYNLVSRLTALDNVLAGRLGHVAPWRGWLRRFSPADRLLALECLDRVGLLGLADQRADRLSGGQQQRVAIARALTQRPDLIVADEPIASLDPNSANGILELLCSIARAEGVAVVCSLHQVRFARTYAQRIIGLAHGRVVFAVPTSQFDQAAYGQLYGTLEPSAASSEIAE
jgi:phosphonate transport system ATP-binding protein